MSTKKEILTLLMSGKIKESITELISLLETSNQDDLYNNIILISSRFNTNEEMYRKNIISDGTYILENNKISNALKDYIQNDLKEVTGSQSINLSNKTSVFISYSHKDSVIANKIKSFLENRDIEVKIDINALAAGGDIKAFIEESIKYTDCTISIVSKDSLLSSWVAMESTNAINAEKFSTKKFFAVFIDDNFFKRSFPDEALDKIEKEILEIKDVIKVRLEKNRGIQDLENELSRFQDLKHNLPKIIKRLKESYSINIQNDEFDEGMERLIDVII